MADISKEELRKEIAAILKDVDLATMSAKKVRQQLEEKLDCDLMPRKKEIDDLVMEYVNSKDKKKGGGKKKKDDSEEEENGEGSEEEEEEEEAESEEEKKKPAKRQSTGKKPAAKKAKKGSSDESDASEGSDGESDEEYSPKKGGKPAKGRKLPPKKKKGSESDSDEDWAKAKKAKKGGGGGGGAKRGGGGYTRAYKLTPELANLVGAESMARHEVVKKIWSIVKERNLYDPKNKQYAICDDDLLKVIGTKRFRTFAMMKYLKSHFLD